MVVDDDREIRNLIAGYLTLNGYEVERAGNAAELDQILCRISVDLIILDVMLPGEDGLSICRRLSSSEAPPVILLSARGEIGDRVQGLDIGASHYLAKPCSVEELLATVRAALRTHAGANAERPGSFLFCGWRIDLATHELFDPDGVYVDLTDGEFAVLRAFVTHPRRVLPRATLLEAARGRDSEAFDRAIDVQVSRLRRKLRAKGDTIIRTVRHEGYLFVPAVSSHVHEA